MPTYEYRCKGCGADLEVVQSFDEPSLTVCPQCSGPLRKVFGSIGITFKGDGFYKNDNRSNGKRNGSSSNGSESSSSSESSKSSDSGGDHGHSHGNGGSGDHSHSHSPDRAAAPSSSSSSSSSATTSSGSTSSSDWRVSRADVGVFGGSGLYSFLDDVDTVDVETPYGAPSGPVTVGSVGDRRVAFLPRHGRRHELPPHRINYRANVWAMRELGVRAIVAPCAAGSLQAHIHPGELVVVDQLVDRTSGRADTFFDGPEVHHVSFAEPYDAGLRAVLVAAAAELGLVAHDGGTMVVVQGPRFSTRAESRWFGSMGWEVINMTGYPEAVLAAELAIPYAAVALITDYDAGLAGVDGISIDGIEPVTEEMVFSFFEGNIERVRTLLFAAIPRLP